VHNLLFADDQVGITSSCDHFTEERISETRRVISMLNSVLWNRNIVCSTKLLIHKLKIKSISTYGAETCVNKTGGQK
jgi:hypothetical protein